MGRCCINRLVISIKYFIVLAFVFLCSIHSYSKEVGVKDHLLTYTASASTGSVQHDLSNVSAQDNAVHNSKKEISIDLHEVSKKFSSISLLVIIGLAIYISSKNRKAKPKK